MIQTEIYSNPLLPPLGKNERLIEVVVAFRSEVVAPTVATIGIPVIAGFPMGRPDA